MLTIHKLQTLHPLEAEAEQLGVLAAWADLEAQRTLDFFAWIDLKGQSYLCSAKQLVYLELYGRTQCRVN